MYFRLDQNRPMNVFFHHFQQKEFYQTKHEVLVNGIMKAIVKKEVRSGESLPSVNSFMKELSMSRMTVLKALNDLKDRGIIESKNRVGYFVKSENVKQQLKVMLFLTAFNPYQEALYNAILKEISGRDISVDLFFHHGNSKVLSTILKENLGKYGLYVITPIEDQKVIKLLDRIPDEKLLQIVRPVCSKKEISFISQDFYSEVITALEKILNRIKKYEKFILICPSDCSYPKNITKAFINFCNKNNVVCSVEEKPLVESQSKGTAYFIIEDSHLIKVICDAENYGFKLGKDIGILSYNETPMKEIIRQGITVISTDFQAIGQKTARFILEQKSIKEVIKTKIILRNSL